MPSPACGAASAGQRLRGSVAAVALQAGDAVKGKLQNRGIDVKREAHLLLRQTGKAELRSENLES